MLPLIFVSGFLGSGKTTLMRRLILEGAARGLRLAVVVNEFGESDVDAALLRVASQNQSAEVMAALAGGCACCAGQDEFVETLRELVLRPKKSRPEVVLVEFSGLADPVVILETLAGPELAELVRPALLIGVADAARWDGLVAQVGPLLRRQIALADVLVVNKADLVDWPLLKKLEQKLAEVNPRATIFAAREAEFPLEDLWANLAAAPERTHAGTAVPHAHSHTIFHPLPHPLQREGLEEALKKLPSDVWRVKGFVRLAGEGGLWLVQFSGGDGTGRWQLAPFYPAWGAPEPNLGIVFIGAALDNERLEAEFRKLSAF